MRICVIGLGKLGAPLAAVLADSGHEVIGVDANAGVVDELNRSRTGVEEPGLADLIDSNKSRIRATTDTASAVASADATFIVVPTPSTPSGTFSNQFVLAVIEDVGRGLRLTSPYHVVAVTSTMMPGSTDVEIAPALERSSGRTIGASLGLCYNPEFIALGSVIRDLRHADVVLIGESDARAGSVIESVHRTFIRDSTHVRRMRWVNAEIAKLAVNTFVTTKISYANMLAELCERVPGADVDIVTEAIGLDARIGHRYLRGAVGYGGPCFPRDNAALAAAAAMVGARADLAVATDVINRRQAERLATLVRDRVSPGTDRVCVLGLSYKADTPVVENSQGVILANLLSAAGFAVTVFDPAASSHAKSALASSIAVADSLAGCLDASDLAIVAVPWTTFREIPMLLRAKPRRRLIVVDCWRLLDAAQAVDVAEIVHIGKGLAREVPAFRT